MTLLRVALVLLPLACIACGGEEVLEPVPLHSSRCETVPVVAQGHLVVPSGAELESAVPGRVVLIYAKSATDGTDQMLANVQSPREHGTRIPFPLCGWIEEDMPLLVLDASLASTCTAAPCIRSGTRS